MLTKTLSRILATALLTAAASPAATVFDQLAMYRKVDMATKYFETVWAQIFASRGAR